MKPNDPKLYWYLEKLEELRRHPQTKIIGLSKEEFLEDVDFLFGPILDNQGKTIFIEDFRYIPFVIEKLLKINLAKHLQASNVPQEIIQAAEELGEEGEIERTRLVARDKVETFIKKQEQLKAANIVQAEKEITNKIQAHVKASLPGSLAKDPEIVAKLSKVIEEEVLFGYFETILPEKLSPQFLQKVTQNLIETADDLPERLIKAEPSLPQNVTQLVQANLKNLTWSPETTATIKELNQTGFVLPRPLREKLPPAGGPASVLGALRSPHLFLQKVALFPIAKTAEVVSKAGLDNEESLLQEIEKLRADPHADEQKIEAKELQAYELSRFRSRNKIFTSFSGLTKEDLERFRTHLTVARGLGLTDFRVRYVDRQIEAMSRLKQQSRLARFYEHYLRLNREAGLIQPRMEIGQREVFLPRTKPLSGFSQKFVGFGEQIGYYRQFVEYPGIGVIRSVPLQKFADFRSLVYRKTLQPVFARLGQTAIGQGIKSGIRGLISKGATQGLTKFGTAILTKLGIKGITSALGTAIGGPIGTAIGLAVGFIIDKVKNLLSKFKQLITKPEYALGLGAIGGLFIIGVPGTMGIAIGAPFLALSGIGLAASAGGVLGGASAATVAILTAFFAPLGTSTAALAALVIGIILGLFFLTLFIVFLTASAFIIPAAPTERVSEYLEVNKTANPSVIDANANFPLTINYNVTITAQQPNTTITNAYDEKSISCRENPPSVGGRTNLNLNPSGTNKWTASYPFEVQDDSFMDCSLCNTVTIVANIEGVSSGEMATDTVCVNIGNPPENCPSGWPTPHGYITQGPNTPLKTDDWCTSHYHQEAIDIGGVGSNTPVYATHKGTVSYGYSNEAGNYVTITGNCSGKRFTSYYYHLSSINPDLKKDPEVSRGDQIGITGMTGSKCKGAHLHYEFDILEMDNRYIPITDDILENCCTPCSTCEGGREYQPCVNQNDQAISW
jgi:hypothetical protein